MNTSQAEILLIEDDESLRITLADILHDEGYHVITAGDCHSARHALLGSDYKLIILDLMLPDGNGYDLCRELRNEGYQVPILMLTARSLEDDLVKGFDSGADDYLVKPYRTGELLARIKSLIKRGHLELPERSKQIIEVNQFSIDREARVANDINGKKIDLTPKEFEIFLFLWDNPQRAYSREHILDQVWGKEVVVDHRTVDNFVSSLKKKLVLKPGNLVSIETVRGVGYRLER